ncbi:MAG TPA: ABC transporter permease [Gemmatimonadaceae bacterium]|nr:ABC transporter permease [Gemmatimonadaceae bacterium]
MPSEHSTPPRAGFIAQVAFSLRTAVEAVSHNTLRAALTSLGILFGVASVIAMLAIGNGAKQEILEQMRLLGTNNVIVTPIVEQKEGKVTNQDQDEKQPKRFTPGLTARDAASIAQEVPAVEATSGEVVLQTHVTREGHRRSARVVGVDTSYFRLLNLELQTGAHFTPEQVEHAAPVAIIGYGVKTRFFTTEQPLGHPVKVGNVWLTVVGVLKDRRIPGETAARLGIRDANMDVYVPLSTMLVRYRNRAEVTERDIKSAARASSGVVIIGGSSDDNSSSGDDKAQAERKNPNQLDRIIVGVDDASHVPGVAEVVRRMLTRRHNKVVDFQITVPELLLKQEQRTKTIFNIVLGSIASISLVVGGIGIMNIMLASILERIREIGVRRAVGASQRDILAQFLSEAVMISLAGGVAGIIAGTGLSYAIQRIAGIHSVVSSLSVIVAFGVSISVGLVFGIVPAWRAARQDPVECLRYE